MNEQQPYEKHLADKLQHLPPPADMNRSWEQMRTLLDKEMPRGGGMSGHRRWWIFGIAIGVLFVATWLSGESFLKRKAPTPVAAQTPQQSGHVDNNTVLPRETAGTSATAQQPEVNDGSIADNGIEKSRGEPVAAAGDKVPENAARNTSAANPDKSNLVHNDNKRNNTNTAADDAIATPKNIRTENNSKAEKTTIVKNNRYSPSGKKKSNDGRRQGNVSGEDVALTDEDVVLNKHTNTGKKKPGKTANDAGGTLTNIDRSWSKPFVERLRSTTVKAPLRYIDSKPAPSLYPATAIEKDYALKSGLLPDRSVAKATASKKKVQKNREAGVLAVGLSLPLAFPLGDQRAMGYNFRAGHNTVSDYLPSPHVQYHINGKTFLQTEAQLMAPQFIRSILLHHDMIPMSPNYYTTKSIYAKKLYYFNLPVSIHHSPFPNFYIGTGLQFSSLISGVALSEERKWGPGGNNMLVKETYTRFRNDSLSQKINGNEFRLLLDANYYFNRFTVGLRYNQALTNYISFRVGPATPYSFDKNRALQFYLRYNLWEDRKQGNNNKTLLTLK